jgi:hypothetical protein
MSSTKKTPYHPGHLKLKLRSEDAEDAADAEDAVDAPPEGKMTPLSCGPNPWRATGRR